VEKNLRKIKSTIDVKVENFVSKIKKSDIKHTIISIPLNQA